MGRIVKATQHVMCTINGHLNAPPNKLQAIQHLKDLITGAAKCTPKPKPAPELESTNLAKEEAVETDLVPGPIHISPDHIYTAPPWRVEHNGPNVIPFDDTEYDPPTEPEPRYNLWPCKHTVSSAMELIGEANAAIDICGH